MTRQINIFKVIYPWESEDFKKAWIEWRTYKKENWNFHYKSPLSEQAALNILKRISGGRERDAIGIIFHTIKHKVKNFIF